MLIMVIQMIMVIAVLRDDNGALFVPVSEVKEQRRTESGGESLDALEEVFERIQTVTGVDNLDMLVTRFIQGKCNQHNWTGQSLLSS